VSPANRISSGNARPFVLHEIAHFGSRQIGPKAAEVPARLGMARIALTFEPLGVDQPPS